jgi:hypothetical protein
MTLIAYHADGEMLETQIAQALSKELEKQRLTCKQCGKSFICTYPKRFSFTCFACKN